MSGDNADPPPGDKPSANEHSSNGQSNAVPAAIVSDECGKFIQIDNSPIKLRLKRDIIDYLNIAVVTLAFAAAAAAAWQSYRLAELTQMAITNADTESKRQATDTQAALNLTKQAADAATRSADVAETGVRAWVAPVTFTLANIADTKEPLNTRISYQNLGRQPARNVRNWLTLDHISSSNLPSTQWEALQEWQDVSRFGPKEICRNVFSKDTSVLYPTSQPTLSFDVKGNAIGDYKFPDPGTFEYWALVTEVKEQRAVLIAKGCFVYETLGKTRHSTFCVFLQPIPGKDISAWVFAVCPVGNDDY
jgi:hypothetical protein